MKAMLISEFGPPDVMRLCDVATPEPGPDEVLIEVRAVSINRTLDCEVRAGRYALKPTLPHVLGVDPSGIVVAKGAEVNTRSIGDRVVTRPIIGFGAGKLPRMLGVTIWGGYAQFVKTTAVATHIIPDGIDFATATCIARHAPVAFSQLRDHGQIKPGDWVVIMGAAGGLGSAAVQVAKSLGGKVIAAAGSAAGLQTAAALGADETVNYRTQDLIAEVIRITNGNAANIVLDNIGDPQLFALALGSLGRGGRLVTAGGHGGGNVAIDIKHIYQNSLSIIGAPGDKPDDYDASLKAAAEGRLRPIIDVILPLSQAAEAHRRVEAREAIGKVVLEPHKD